MARYSQRVGSLAFLFFLAAAPALAQEGAASPTDSTTGWVFRWINFAIVLALLIYGVRKATPYFRAQQEQIGQKIAEGTRAREAAELRRREVEEKLKGLPQEIERIRAEAKRGGDAEAVRLRAAAKEDAQKIERAAQAEIAAAERAASLELKAMAARMAVERAETLLRDELTPKAEAALFRGFVEGLERSAN
jgi:F0F1-type ATP synthase membrane subunit b/b'